MNNPSNSTAKPHKPHGDTGGYIFPADLADTIWEALWFAISKRVRLAATAKERRFYLKLLRMMEADIEQ